MFFSSPFSVFWLFLIMIASNVSPDAEAEPAIAFPSLLITSWTGETFKIPPRGEELIFWPHPASGQKYRKMAIARPPQLTKGRIFIMFPFFLAYLKKGQNKNLQIILCSPNDIFMKSCQRFRSVYTVCILLFFQTTSHIMCKIVKFSNC